MTVEKKHHPRTDWFLINLTFTILFSLEFSHRREARLLAVATLLMLPLADACSQKLSSKKVRNKKHKHIFLASVNKSSNVCESGGTISPPGKSRGGKLRS